MIPWEQIGTFFYQLSQDVLTMPRLFCLAAVVIGYFCGLFQSAFFISKAMHVDIYSKGSGNPGTTNMLRVMGPIPGILTFLFDIGKAVGAIFLAQYIFLTWLQIPIDPIALKLYTGLGVILGHNFPVYLQGKGGKGVAVTCAIYVCLGEWKYIVIGLFVFLLLFLITRYVSLSSMVVICVLMFEFLFATLMNWTYVQHHWLIDCQILVILYAALVLITHWKNILRLLYEEEPRFRFRRSKREAEASLHAVPEEEEHEFVAAARKEMAAKLESDLNEAIDSAQNLLAVTIERDAQEASAPAEALPFRALPTGYEEEAAEEAAEAETVIETSESKAGAPVEEEAEAEAEEEAPVACEPESEEAEEASVAEEETAEAVEEKSEEMPSEADSEPEDDEVEEETEEASSEETVSEIEEALSETAPVVEAEEEEDNETPVAEPAAETPSKKDSPDYRTNHNKSTPAKKKKKHSTTKKKKSKSAKKKR